MTVHRIRPGYVTYLLTAAVLLTVGSVLARNGSTAAGLACLLALAPLVVFALLDRMEFDGAVIRRSGPLAWGLARLGLVGQRLAMDEIETITTEVASITFASGDARLSYRTRVSGANAEFVLRSSRAGYVPFIRALFGAADPDKLDPCSYELVEYFEGRRQAARAPVLRSEIAVMPVALLRRFANSLRLAGRLAQASSYFRIAYEKEPRNPELLYEMSRFFHSSAQTEDERLLHRADACLRLAARLADHRPALLERIGEAFFERLDYKRASDCFQRALADDPARFRANVGLAEIALRDGKLAHVAHYYNAATAAHDAALRRLAGREARYYERLMSDDGFLEAELRRIRVSHQVRWAQRVAALVFFAALLLSGVAGKFEAKLEIFGLALMCSSGAVWALTAAALRLMRRK